MERKIEMQSALYSIEDCHDDKPSLKVDIDGGMIHIETIYGSTSLFIEDFEQVVAELEKFRRASSLVQEAGTAERRTGTPIEGEAA